MTTLTFSYGVTPSQPKQLVRTPKRGNTVYNETIYALPSRLIAHVYKALLTQVGESTESMNDVFAGLVGPDEYWVRKAVTAAALSLTGGLSEQNETLVGLIEDTRQAHNKILEVEVELNHVVTLQQRQHPSDYRRMKRWYECAGCGARVWDKKGDGSREFVFSHPEEVFDAAVL